MPRPCEVGPVVPLTAAQKVVHSADPAMTPTPLTLRGQSYTAAAPWATLPQKVLDRSYFWHLVTNTPVHPRAPDVLKLMAALSASERLPSLYGNFSDE